jgi:predicted DNA-binding transcriptional regulator YafY
VSRLPKDLTRFLFLVPYVAQHRNGVTVRELEDILSISRAQLAKLLERVAMVGAPDGAPDELVEIFLEGGRVHVALPQRFTRPPRFDVREMMALLAALAPLRENAPPSIGERANELTDRIAGLASERAAAIGKSVGDRVQILADGAEDPAVLRTLELALRERRVIEADYWTAGRDEVSTRRIEPAGLVQVRGAWYLIAGDTKTFKVERFRAVALADPMSEPLDVDLEEARRRLEELDLGDGSVEVRVGERTFRWGSGGAAGTRRWVRAQRGRAAIASPPEAREAMIAETKALLERYEEDP